MKKLFLIFLAGAASLSASAEVFRNDVANGAVLGAIAGAVIGHNSGSLGHNAWRGAAYGAVAGAVIGGIADESRHDNTQVRRPHHTVRNYGSPRYGGHVGYVGYRGYRNHHDRYVRFEPRYSPWAPVIWPAYSYGWNDYGYSDYNYNDSCGEPDGASAGLILGGLAGAIIGRNSGSLGHNAWRGAAYGALAGTVIGSIHDANRPSHRRIILPARAYEPEVMEPAAPAQAAAPQNVTIINNYYVASPMSAANTLFGRN